MHNAAKRNMIAQRRWLRYRALKFPARFCLHWFCQGSMREPHIRSHTGWSKGGPLRRIMNPGWPTPSVCDGSISLEQAAKCSRRCLLSSAHCGLKSDIAACLECAHKQTNTNGVEIFDRCHVPAIGIDHG